MGTDLFQIGNHKIKFTNRKFTDISSEIKQKLDGLIFPNVKFLRNFALNWANGEQQILKIKTKQNWTFKEEDDYYNFAEDKELDFYGPYDLSLTFEENKIWFYNPPVQYWQWFDIEDEIYRNEWRKYMKIIVNLFGGNRVIYLADHTHPLEKFLYLKGTFNEIELALKNKFGYSKQTFEEVANDLKNSYYIDNFENIDWSKNVDIENLETKTCEISNINQGLKI